MTDRPLKRREVLNDNFTEDHGSLRRAHLALRQHLDADHDALRRVWRLAADFRAAAQLPELDAGERDRNLMTAGLIESAVRGD